MNSIIESAPILVVHWLLHCSWILAAVGGVAWLGSQILSKASAQTRSNWTLICLTLVALTIPVSVFAAMSSIENKRFATGTATSIQLTEPTSLQSHINSIQNQQDVLLPRGSGTTGQVPRIATQTQQSISRNNENQPNQQALAPTKIGSSDALGFNLQQPDQRKAQPDLPAGFSDENKHDLTIFESAKKFILKTIDSSSFQQVAAATYFCGLLVMLARLLLASWGYRRFRSNCEPVVDTALAARAKDLAQAIGLRSTPVLMQCQRIVVPMVAGILKPAILLPVSILTEMRAEQLDAILIHELAHLKRKDHLVVVAQRVIESILFFHPVTWWLGRELDAHREAACDDVVLARGTSHVTYAQSLLQLASCKSANQLTVASIGTRPSILASRIRRILQEPIKKKTNCHVALALVGLPLLLMAVSFLQPSLAQIATTETATDSPIPMALAEASTHPMPDDPNNEFYSPIMGVVLDADQNPVSNATVIAQEYHAKRGHFFSYQDEPFAWRIKTKHRQLFQCKTDKDGKFKIDQLEVPREHQYIDSRYPITIVIQADQHSVAWKHTKYAKDDPIKFVLDRSTPQTLRVQSDDGSDIADLQAEVIGFQDSKRLSSKTQFNASHDYLTDVLMLTKSVKLFAQIQNNELSISNLGPQQVAIVRLVADNHEPEIVYISQQSFVSREKHPEFTIAGRTHQLKRLARLKVNVVEKTTGKTIPTANISFSWKKNGPHQENGRTDSNGIALMKNLPVATDYSISVQPPADSSYLAWNDSLIAETRKLKLSYQNEPSEITIELVKGVSIFGKVIDAKTKQGIAGVELTFDPLLTTDVAGQATNVTSDTKGEYRMVVPNVLGKIRLASDFKGYHNYRTKNSVSYRPNVMHDVQNSKQVPPLSLFKKTPVANQSTQETLRLDIAYPDGTPAAGSRVQMYQVSKTGSYSKLDSQKTNSSGQIKLSLQTLFQRELVVIAFDQSGEFATRASMKPLKNLETWPQFLDYKKQLASEKANQESPAMTMPILLQPIAKIKGKLISPTTRKPVSDAAIHVTQPLTEAGRVADWRSDQVESDENGDYEIGVIPNAKARISINHPNYRSIEQVFGDDDSARLQSSEVRSLRHPMVLRDSTLTESKLTARVFEESSGLADPTLPDSSSTEIESITASEVPDGEVEIAVVDAFGDPTLVDIEFWESTYRELGSSTVEPINRPVWQLAKQLTTESPIRLDITPNKRQCIVAKSKTGLVGFVEFNSKSPIEQNRLILKLKKPNQVSGSVIDYDTGKPIAGATLSVASSSPWQRANVVRGKEVTTDESGKFKLDGLIPRMYTRITVTSPKNLRFGSVSKDFEQQRTNGNTQPTVIEVLSESTYQRTLAAARLSLPSTENLSPRESLDLILAQFERRKIRAPVRFRNPKAFVEAMRAKPHFAYLEAVRTIADSAKSNLDNQDNVDVWFDALKWLLDQYSQYSHYKNGGVSDEKSAKDLGSAIADELVENHLHHPRFKDAFSVVNRFPRPNDWLESLLKDHPDHHVQGLAAIELASRNATIVPYILYTQGKESDTNQLAAKQAKQRQYAELVLEKYSDVVDQGYSKRTLDFRARGMIKVLDQFGIGQKPPPLSGTTLAGGNLSTSDFGNKVFVIHFVNFSQTKPLDGILPMQNLRHDFADRLQLIGFLKCRKDNKQSSQRQISDVGIDWPFLWEEIPNMHHGIQIGGGLHWGEVQVAALQKFHSMVIDSDGKIISMGLKGEPLAEFVRSHLDGSE